jgi:ribonuclease E
MLDDETPSAPSTTQDTESTGAAPRRTRRRSASRPAGPPEAVSSAGASEPEPRGNDDAASAASTSASSGDESPPKKKAAKKSASKKATSGRDKSGAEEKVADTAAAKKSSGKKKSGAKKAGKKPGAGESDPEASAAGAFSAVDSPAAAKAEVAAGSPTLLFQPPELVEASPRRSRKTEERSDGDDADAEDRSEPDAGDDSSTPDADEGGGTKRRRSRGGRSRRKSTADSRSPGSEESVDSGDAPADDSAPAPSDADESTGSTRRRRRRRRSGDDSGDANDDAAETVVRVRKSRTAKESITSVEGSTRIEAKRQRRREGREAGRRRPPILSESEFLARRESVERVMVIRQRGEVTQIAVLEDNVLVEHYVALESQNSLIGNVYLGRVQNVLPSMEAAFIDIGRGRNAVLYAGEVNWDLVGDNNQPRRIENALKPGQAVLVQVSKDPVGHKGARLTSQISLPGRYLVLVPGGGTSGISRKLPDTERNRLKNLLKEILPESAGVIIRTAAEGASEDELTRDVTRLTARWEDIEKKSKNGQAPQLLYAEPDTTLKVVRDLFTEDFSKLVISGEDAWDMVDGYVQYVAPDLAERLEHFEGDGDVFTSYRVDEQIAKALDRKVWLPSGGSLVIDRTEAMTVIDVNTGKFTGSGGNLEETVTKNNLEAAEEIVRQLRLRDIGGIIVVDFIDMVLENNRDLVLRRLVECLGRDRTRHQVAEVTSLGLVQMTRKRISTGLLEAFSHTCEVCQGRGVIIEQGPIEPKKSEQSHGNGDASGSRGGSKRSGRSRRGRRAGGSGGSSGGDAGASETQVGDSNGSGSATTASQTSDDDGAAVTTGESVPEQVAEKTAANA